MAFLGVDVEAIAKEVDAEREAQLALKAQKTARRAEKEAAKTKPTLPKGKAKGKAPAATTQEKKPRRRRSRQKAAA